MIHLLEALAYGAIAAVGYVAFELVMAVAINVSSRTHE